ncbi:MAG: alanine--tRNA ligase-related protein [Candidatus Dojkabacteria bacterium]
MKTETIYLLEPYIKTTKAKVLEVFTEGDNQSRVILDKTVFYPMGGGQPTDQGKFMLSDGSFVEVFQVQIKDGEIWHSIKTNQLKVGDEVDAEINWERRYQNMKMHSAGHIIDCSLVKLGLVPNSLSPLKADHGKKPFILYSILKDVGDLNELKEKIQNTTNDLINSDLKFSWGFVTLDELSKEAVYLQPNLPSNKPLRMLKLEGVGSFADGGTIVQKTSEVGGITIEEIIKEGDTLKVSYSINKNQEMSEKTVKEIQPHVESEYVNETEIISTVNDEVAKAASLDELTNLWRKYLGKEGIVTELMKTIKDVPNDKRKDFGQSINNLKASIDALINGAKENIQNSDNKGYLSIPQSELNFSKAKVGHLHPLTQTELDLNAIFRSIGFSVMDGPELETDEYSFQRLNLPMDHPARDLLDSIFVEEPNILLRTQTSSIEAHVIEDFKPPFKVVMPGRVYRNEKVNRTNHFTFHQYQMTAVKEKVSMAELFAIINYMFKTFLGDDVEIRFRCKYYPEVEPGVGPDLRCFNCHGEGCAICKGRGWIEMGGAGIIHPNVLKMGGLDPSKWQGYAFGMGLDRWAMAKYKITDIRTLLGGNLAYKPN